MPSSGCHLINITIYESSTCRLGNIAGGAVPFQQLASLWQHTTKCKVWPGQAGFYLGKDPCVTGSPTSGFISPTSKSHRSMVGPLCLAKRGSLAHINHLSEFWCPCVCILSNLSAFLGFTFHWYLFTNQILCGYFSHKTTMGKETSSYFCSGFIRETW